MKPELEKIGLKMTYKKVTRMIESASSPDKLVGKDIYTAIEDFRDRFSDEIEDGYFLSLTPKEVECFEPKEPPFGKTIQDKFPALVEDISEAGKCLALARYTASVFHLMRVMEVGVHKFGETLGLPLAHEMNWQNILDQANKAIRALDQKASTTKTYAEISSNLYNVKLAWRNEVMHPKATYTPDEAEAVFAATRSFMRELVSVL